MFVQVDALMPTKLTKLKITISTTAKIATGIIVGISNKAAK
jgi:hypothetical protein